MIVIHTGTYNEVSLYEIYTNGTRNYYYENTISFEGKLPLPREMKGENNVLTSLDNHHCCQRDSEVCLFQSWLAAAH